MALHIHALRESLIQAGLLPEAIPDTLGYEKLNTSNYERAWAVQLALLERGYPVPAVPRERSA